MDMYGPSSPSTQAPFSVSITQAVGKEANANVCFNGRSWDGSILLAFPFGRLAGQCARSKTKQQQQKLRIKKKQGEPASWCLRILHVSFTTTIKSNKVHPNNSILLLSK